MTDPSDYSAKIRAKGLDATGVTEQLAAEMYRNKGRHYMAIVELRVDETHEKADGARKVDLILTQVEPATSTDLEEHLRELTRVGYLNRQQADGQLAIDTSLGQERTVADVLSSGQSFRPHPFLPDDAAKDTPICDVCGGIEASAVHSTQDILDTPDQDTTEIAEEDEPHAFFSDDDVDSCRLCGRHEADGEGIHVATPKVISDPAEDHAEPTGEEIVEPTDPWAYDGPRGHRHHHPRPLHHTRLRPGRGGQRHPTSRRLHATNGPKDAPTPPGHSFHLAGTPAPAAHPSTTPTTSPRQRRSRRT